MIDWSAELVAALSLEGVKNLRANALTKGIKEVVELCDADLAKRAPVRVKIPKIDGPKFSKRGQYVTGYHFVCPRERGITQNGDGTIWTGTWVVDKSNAERSTKYGAYVALHVAKSDPSYLQGNLKDWRPAKRDREYADGQMVKIPMGVEFLIVPSQQPYKWNGDSSGEKGYLWKAAP